MPEASWEVLAEICRVPGVMGDEGAAVSHAALLDAVHARGPVPVVVTWTLCAAGLGPCTFPVKLSEDWLRVINYLPIVGAE